MTDKERLDSLAESLAGKTDNATITEAATAVEKLTGHYKSETELKKLQAEIEKLNAEKLKIYYDLEHAAKLESVETRLRYITAFTPVITTLVLVLTLLFQTFQFMRSERDKQEASDAAAWEEAVRTVTKSTNASPVSIALNPFLSSKQYSDRAHKIAVQVLSVTNDRTLFSDLFRSAFVPVQWSNLEDILQLNRSLNTKVNSYSQKAFDPATGVSDESKLTNFEQASYRYGLSALEDISKEVAPLLRGSRPKGAALGLKSVWMYHCDLKAANLANADLQNADFRWDDLTNADLSGIHSFSGLYVSGTAWWEASKIDSDLLNYLELAAPYKSTQQYGINYRKIPQAEYEAGIKRLTNNHP